MLAVWPLMRGVSSQNLKSTKMKKALLVKLSSIKNDAALGKGQRGDRKILVTQVCEEKEEIARYIEWEAPTKPGQKCPVQKMENTEMAVFTHEAKQDRHYHKLGTEIYDVIEGQMNIEVEGANYLLGPGDTIVVNPNSCHEVKPAGTRFVCRVLTVSCSGTSDKYSCT